MRATVAYESMFGNTRAIAEAIAAGLRAGLPESAEVTTEEIGALSGSPEVDLLVIGTPNHGFSLPRADSRTQAQGFTTERIVTSGTGVREWLDTVATTSIGAFAVFDLRMAQPQLLVRLDHASSTVEKALRKAGVTAAAPAEHFRVVDRTGPLGDGEIERARAWGRSLAMTLVHG